ncbi:hypothetical protein [Spirosoma sp.]|uniref:hypothetical protein n=1 Tax=Spirosoma sp. TaxID=1899569 RepID=UPI003B3A3054
MRTFLTLVALLASLKLATAQLSMGNNGMTILAGTPFSTDGLTLLPSANLTIANNTIQRTSTPLANYPGINRLYQLSAPLLFSGTVGLFYLPSELNGYAEYGLKLAYSSSANGPLTYATSTSVNTSTHYVSSPVTNQNLRVITASAQSDLTPTLYARPSTVGGTKPISVVVDVFELNGAPTHGPITVKLTKDIKVSLSLSARVTQVGGRPVQNSVWIFDGDSDEDYYVLTTNYSIAAGDVLSFGLTGSLTPGATSGNIVFSTVVGPGSGSEVYLLNNSDADKLEFFQQ